MAEQFGEFGINTAQGSANISVDGGFGNILKEIQPRLSEAKRNSPEAFLRTLPPQLVEVFNKLAEFGLFGEGGVEELMRSISRQGGLERRGLAQGLKRGSLGRRLGPRSGAIDNLIANKVFAPSFAGTEAARRNLLVENQRSKLGGLQGIQDLLGFFQNQFALDEGARQGPGFLDFVSPLATLGGAIFGGPAGAVAGSAINKGREFA